MVERRQQFVSLEVYPFEALQWARPAGLRGSKQPSIEVPPGCVGFMLVFDSLEALRDWSGSDAGYREVIIEYPGAESSEGSSGESHRER